MVTLRGDPLKPTFSSFFRCRHPSAVSTSHHDERGAGFYAVGFARAGRGRGGTGAYSSPTTSAGSGGSRGGSGALGMCAVVTSSGTAVANLLPAAAEADAAGLAMVLLTADRPPELRGCGANQTIDQVWCVRCAKMVGVWRGVTNSQLLLYIRKLFHPSGVARGDARDGGGGRG